MERNASTTKWEVLYVVGTRNPWYKTKYISADTAESAIRKARVKNIVDLRPIPEREIDSARGREK